MEKSSKLSLGIKILIGIWILFFVGILSVFTIFKLISDGKIGYLPPIEDLQNPKSKYATEIYTCDMKTLGRYFISQENRIYTPYEEISPYVIDALISTEDIRFHDHSGIDGRALVRVAFKTILMGQDKGGGSTITQQLAKLFFTEQRAKNKIERMKQKLTEWVIAVKLEKYYTKEEIITMYLNKFDWNHNAVGIKSASQIYFNKAPKDLTIEEAATLVGMLQNPTLYDPVRDKFKSNCLTRRNVVLSQMVVNEKIDSSQLDSLSSLEIVTNYQKVDHKLGLAPYFREHLRIIMNATEPNPSKYPKWMRQKYYEDSIAWAQDPLYGWCNKNTKPDGTPYNLYADGLKIYTTIDSRMQQYAEDAIKEYLGGYLQPLFFKEKSNQKNKKAPFSNKSTQAQVDSILVKSMRQSDRYYWLKKEGKSEKEILEIFNKPITVSVFDWEKGSKDTLLSPMDSIRYQKSFLRAGMMSIDPFNGHVKAYVGGPNFNFFQYDMVCTGKRQVGSTIKPFLYTLAMIDGMEPCTEVPNVQPHYEDPVSHEIWTPRNVPYGEDGKKEVGQMITLKRGLQTSNNWISAHLVLQIGAGRFANFLNNSLDLKSKVDPVPPICLGAMDVSISEMVSAYTAFANKGIKASPVLVTRIEDNNGNIIATFDTRMKEVYDPETASKMISLLQGVINGGTGLRLRTKRYDYCVGWETPVAGKTGTTQNNSDGWFMGFVPNLVTGVWVGGEDRDIHFDNLRNGQGSATALPIWGKYMNKVYNDSTIGYSRTEQFVTTQRYDCSTKDSHPVLDEDAAEMILF
ncbi:MAG: transglycosylase domain-containing protein [Paludibacteraceae bacterium]|nr:transglycosylase domain-containing protein [Paludibacteraceae bacterium]